MVEPGGPHPLRAVLCLVLGWYARDLSREPETPIYSVSHLLEEDPEPLECPVTVEVNCTAVACLKVECTEASCAWCFEWWYFSFGVCACLVVCYALLWVASKCSGGRRKRHRAQIVIR